MMKIEKPCSPGHCLGMLNDNMRTDILRNVHHGIEFRKDNRDKKSPLEMLIESIEDVLATYEGYNLFELIERNPFNANPSYPFDPKSDYQHDIKLLKSQLRSLKKILASLDRF